MKAIKEQQDKLNKAIQEQKSKTAATTGKYYKYKQKYLQLKNNTL